MGMSDPWTMAQRLIGVWEGPATGRPGSGVQRREYKSVLDGHFLLGTNQTRWEASPSAEAFVHEDISVLSADRGTGELRLLGFYSEGLVHDYRCREAGADGSRLVFEAVQVEGGPPGMRARETIELVGDDGLRTTFELAMPGGGFEPYTHEELHRTDR